jgi:glycosyltransferase involved in cell wall biosynthesis
MKLIFDARYIRTDFHDGISRYSAELANAVAKQTPVTFMISDLAQRKYLPENSEYILMHGPTSPREPLTSIILNKYNPDVVFSPMQTMGSIGKKFKLILTTHDLIYYRHRTPPRNINTAIKIGWVIFHLSYGPERALLKEAEAVATVSETTRKELILVKMTKHPIVVIPNAPQELSNFLDKPVQFKKDGPRNLVYMGSFMPYKNVETLIAALAWLPGYTLHLLSRITPKRKKALLDKAPKGSSIIFHGGVSDEKYAHILADNAILVSASLDEGYGLPVAEALELGIPGVITDMPIFHEVADGGALYAAGLDPKDFADKILLLNEPELLKKLTTAGQKHVAKYNWASSAKRLVELAESLAR